MDSCGQLALYILFITVASRVSEVQPAEFIFGGEARRVCKAYKRVCSDGKVCALQSIDWPHSMKFPVCVYRQHKRVKSNVCRKAPQPGRCAARFTRWYYNIHMQSCSWFIYSGCGGNKNNFRTFDECTKTCSTSSKAAVATKRRHVNDSTGHKINATEDSEMAEPRDHQRRIPVPAPAPEVLDVTSDVTGSLSLDESSRRVIKGGDIQEESKEEDDKKKKTKKRKKLDDQQKAEKRAKSIARKLRKQEIRRQRKLARERRRREKLLRKRRRELMKRRKKEKESKKRMEDRVVYKTEVSVDIPGKVVEKYPEKNDDNGKVDMSPEALRRQMELQDQMRRRQEQQLRNHHQHHQNHHHHHHHQRSDNNNNNNKNNRQHNHHQHNGRLDSTKTTQERQASRRIVQKPWPKAVENKPARQLTPLELGPYYGSNSSPLRETSDTSSDIPDSFSTLGRYRTRKWLIDDRFGLSRSERRRRQRRRRRRRRRKNRDERTLILGTSNIRSSSSSSSGNSRNWRMSDSGHGSRRLGTNGGTLNRANVRPTTDDVSKMDDRGGNDVKTNSKDNIGRSKLKFFDVLDTQ